MTDSVFSETDPNSIREYMITLLSTLKKIKIKRAELEKKLKIWEQRVTLAANNNRNDLKTGAKQKTEEIKGDLRSILAEEKELQNEIKEIKRKIITLKNQPEYTVDADLLLVQLQMITGEPDKLSEEFVNEQAEAALKELKQKLKPDN